MTAHAFLKRAGHEVVAYAFEKAGLFMEDDVVKVCHGAVPRLRAVV